MYCIQSSYLIELCAGFPGQGLDDLHILYEEPTKIIDLRQIGTLPPNAAESYVSQAVSPSRVETQGIRVNAGNLSASNEATGGKLSGPMFAVPGVAVKHLQVPEPTRLE